MYTQVQSSFQLFNAANGSLCPVSGEIRQQQTCIHIHSNADTQTQTDRQTHKQTDRQTHNTQTDTHTHTPHKHADI